MLNRKFLIGVLVGVLLATGIYSAVDRYRDLNTRLGFVEGYIRQLDHMIREQSSYVPQHDSSRAAL